MNKSIYDNLRMSVSTSIRSSIGIQAISRLVLALVLVVAFVSIVVAVFVLGQPRPSVWS